jgi:hypothetical protein
MWGALSDERTGLTFTIAAGLASTVIPGHFLGNRTRDLPACSIVPQLTTLSRASPI